MKTAEELDARARTEKPIPQAELHPYQRAIVETALAYYYRGMALQYDSVELTQQSRWGGGVVRSTTGWPPERPTEDDPMFSVCSAFCYDVLYHTFSGYRLFGSPTQCVTINITNLPEDHPLVAFRLKFETELKNEDPIDDRIGELKRLEEALQPGDILCGYGKDTGHAMMYVGRAFADNERYLVHCWGQKYKMDKGMDDWETSRNYNWEGGTIQRNSLTDFLYNPTAMWAIGRQRILTVLRPLNILPTEEYPLNPVAAYRLRFPRLTVNRRADHDCLRSVEEGGKITVTVGIVNNAPSAYTEKFTVTEKIPENCRLKPNSITGGGVRKDEKTIVWEPGPMTGGQELSLRYTVIATGKRGETIHLTGGAVGELPTNDIPVRIGGRPLKEEQIEALAEIREGDRLADGKLEGSAFAEKFYEKYFGVCPKIPTLEELTKTLFVPKDGYAECPVPLLTPVEDFYEKAPMLVPKFFGGTDVWTEKSRDRTLTLNERQMVPGDVFLAKENLYALGVPDCFVYLGNDRFAYGGEDGTIRIKTYTESAQKLFSMGVFFGLRPTLAYEDIYAV